MMALYGPREPEAIASIRARLAGSRVRIIARWRDFEQAALRAECAIVVIPSLRDRGIGARFVSLRNLATTTGVVLVTQFDRENVRSLKDVSVDEVIWLDEVPSGIVEAIHRAIGRSALSHFGARIERAMHLGPALRRALVLACRSEHPVRSVQQLAGLCGCDRRTLARQWRQHSRRTQLRLKDFLDWLLLLNAHGWSHPHLSWHAIGAQLGIEQQAMRRQVRYLLGLTLREFAVMDHQALLREFERTALDPLLAASASRKHERPYRRGPRIHPTSSQAGVSQNDSF